jgi:hypothetical protein
VKKSIKIAILAVVLIVVAVVPIYIFTRPPTTPTGIVLTVTGHVYTPLNISWDYLTSNEIPIGTVDVNLKSNTDPSENGEYTYTVVALYPLLQKAFPYQNATSVTFYSSNGLSVTLTTQEISENQNTIGIAIGKDGLPLTWLKNGGEGPLRLIVPTDANADRWIKGLNSIVVN